MQVHLTALGCRLNEAELEQWAGKFQSQGHSITRDPNAADMVVINTCAVTQESARKSRQIIRRTHRYNPQAKLVVSGCYSSLSPKLNNEIDGIDLIVSNQDKERLVEITEREFAMDTMPAQATLPGTAALFARGRDRAFIKIQDGCRYQCAFCIVTVARGKERSRKIEDIVFEINQLNSQGIQEAVLTGVHVGGYGSDINSSMFELIQAILSDTKIPRLRLASVEPWDLHPDFFDLFQDRRLMPHMHLPLQSGSDTVLRRMARRCKIADYKKLIDVARDRIPDFNVTTDIIVGFPGETESEWQEGLAFIEEIGFSHLHIFPYSARSGTRAAELSNQIETPLKKSRCRELQTVAKRMKEKYLQQLIGREFSVLWESDAKEHAPGYLRYFGYTSNFIRACTDVPVDNNLGNKILSAQVAAVSQDGEKVLVTLI